MQNVKHIRDKFKELYLNKKFVENKNKTGSKTIELIGETFVANEDYILGEVNNKWVKRESEWYHSMSLNVNDIPGGPPPIWKMVSSDEGFINSNYGWCIFSKDNYNQFQSCLEQLLLDENSRRAEMIYTRPKIQIDYNHNNMSDFICTECVQYFIRDNKLITIVKMRSNDAFAGYRGDLAWQKEVRELLFFNLKNKYETLELGDIIWSPGSLHFYERDFYLLEHYIKTNETHITKNQYELLYNK